MTIEGLGSSEKKIRIAGQDYLPGEDLPAEIPLRAEIMNFLEAYHSHSNKFYVQTSGSTGRPKTITLQKEHMRASALKTLQFLELSPGDSALLCLPLNKIAGIMMLTRWLEGDLDLYPKEPASEPLAGDARHYHFVAMVPLQAQSSLDQLEQVDKIIIGGAPILSKQEASLSKVKCQIYHSYGMTETISHVALRRIGEGEGIFKAMPGVTFAEEQSCLLINAPDIGVEKMLTNDVVELIDEQHFRWLGRRDNVVNSGGYKLHPELLENRLGDLGFPYFLAGQPDETLGEKLVLVAEGKPSFSLASIDFKDLDRYERPRDLISIDRFIYTSNGKLKREETLSRL